MKLWATCCAWCTQKWCPSNHLEYCQPSTISVLPAAWCSSWSWGLCRMHWRGPVTQMFLWHEMVGGCSSGWARHICVAEHSKICEKARVVQKVQCPKFRVSVMSRTVLRIPLLLLSSSFFISQCRLLSPFLDRYQTEATMLPFLADDLAGILEQLMAKFVKADVLHHARRSTTKLQKIDINAADNLKPVDKIDQLLSSSHLTAQHCDEAKRQYEKFQVSATKHHSSEFSGFKPSERLDIFFYARISQDPKYQELWQVIKIGLDWIGFV